MKRLIVNADDFGLTAGVNRAIGECHLRGIVTSATMMATGGALEEAAAMASQLPQLGVGCHVVLVDGRPVLPAADVRSLLEPGTDRFYHSLGPLLRALARGGFRADEVEAEADAQIGRLQKTGLKLTHFDAHKHVHMFLPILRPLLRAAKKCGITAVRNPFEPAGNLRWNEAISNRGLLLRKVETSLLRAGLRRGWMREVQRQGLATTDGSLGVTATGALDQPTLDAMLRRIPAGCWELVCHPGYNDAELAAVRTKLRESREVELKALTSLAAAELESQYGVTLGTFADFTLTPVNH